MIVALCVYAAASYVVAFLVLRYVMLARYDLSMLTGDKLAVFAVAPLSAPVLLALATFVAIGYVLDGQVVARLGRWLFGEDK